VPGLLVVPASPQAASGMRKLPIMYAPPIPVVVRRVFHTVKPGDSWASIGKRYGVAVDSLRSWNPGASVTPGKRMVVEVRSAPKGKPRPKPKPKPRNNS
jgi:hypothetical protein